MLALTVAEGTTDGPRSTRGCPTIAKNHHPAMINDGHQQYLWQYPNNGTLFFP